VRAVAREAADHKAWEVYQLLEVGKRGEATAKLEALRDQPLSKTERAVLGARVHDTQVMEVETALKAAAASFKAGRPSDVIKPLEAALTGEPASARAATIHYYLGVAYARTELDKAISHLQAAIAGDVDQEDVRFQLASALDRSGAYALARAEYDWFATAHPQSPLAVFAMRRSATLVRMPAAAPPAAGATPAPPPGAQPTTPAAPASPQGTSAASGAAVPPAGHATAPAAPGTRLAPGAATPPTGSRPWNKPPAKPFVPWKQRPASPSDDPAASPRSPSGKPAPSEPAAPADPPSAEP
jgi:tetratricopeptide (TPR) repeat protein